MAKAKSNHPQKQKRKFWKKHIASWQETEISQAEYCRRNGLKTKSFTYWKKKHKPIKDDCVSFVPVPLTPAIDVSNNIGRGSLCLLLDERYRIEVGDDFSEFTLQRLLHVLERI